ncbi:hypothetical protein AAHA92_24716 [Salvia divinorum]
MKEQDSTIRKSKIQDYLKGIPFLDNEHLILVVSELWSLAMTRPDDEELLSLGLFQCMTVLMNKAIHDRSWLLKHQNIYIPYYAAHIVGSYTMKRADSAARAVDSGVVQPLLELLRGEMSWVEQRVAVRALGHLASYEKTFEAVAVYEEEVVELALNLAISCLENVYREFVEVKDGRERVRYHCNLLTRGAGGAEMEGRKAEEWASQLQCWSIHLLNCFAVKERCLHLICKRGFLEKLCGVWGGLANQASPGGIGLIRILCHTRIGRESISKSKNVIENLCNVSRSSDEWQYMGIDCLLLLLKDVDSRHNVIDSAALCLVDLVELKNLGNRRSLGDSITRALLHDYKKTKIKNGDINVQRSLEEIWLLKVERRRREKLMSRERIEERRMMVKLIKQQGNHHFLVGHVGEAISKYDEALEICPLKHRSERMIVYSKRAHCHLFLRDGDAAIRDATRALCLSSPPNSHDMSLWIRAQAYDMKGMAKESLMDCIVFMNVCIRSGGGSGLRILYYVVRMICKQMEKTWLFREARIKIKEEAEIQVKKCKNYGSGLSTIMEEPCVVRDGIGKKKIERVINGISNKTV